MQFYIALLLLVRSVIAIDCNGDWILALPQNLICSTGTFEYKYQSTTDPNVYYLTPQTSNAWSWDTYTAVSGTYYYTTDGGNTLHSFACTSNEAGSRGIGCSNGGGGEWKVFSISSENRNLGQTHTCQDQPGIFGEPCATANIYYRECTGSCNTDALVCGTTASDWIQAFPSNLMNTDVCNADAVFQYKYELSSNPDRFYLSPMTSTVWSWDIGVFTQADGIYEYTIDGGNTFDSYVCAGGETVSEGYGIGCSTGGGDNLKTMAAYVSDPILSQANVCQDQPTIFGSGCQSQINIYYRECSGNCNVDVLECGATESDWVLALPENLDVVCEEGTVLQYKYELSTDPNVYYLSPLTSNVWSWDTVSEGNTVEVKGIYEYTVDGGHTFESFDCQGGELVPESYGIGCSTGGGPSYKAMPAYPLDANTNPDAAQANLCQDEPGILGATSCESTNIYYRVCSGSCSKPIEDYACSFEIISNDHSGGTVGAYFNFDRATIDCILGTEFIDDGEYDVFYSGTNTERHVVMWRSPNGGSDADAHGRIEPSASAGDWEVGECIAFVGDVSCNCADETYLCHNNNNKCENATTFIWEELLEDEIGKPNFATNMDIDESTLTLKINISLDYVGYTAADDNGYVYGTTYVIDFEDFDAHAANIREPGNCQNRAPSSILSNAEWSDLWSYSSTPNEADHVGGTSFLAYPSAGEWTVGMASEDECGTIQYTTELTWNELTSCSNYDGTLGQYIDVNDDGGNITLSGTLYINVVSPYDYNSESVPYYRVYQLLSQPFMIVVSKTVYVVDSVGINLLTMDVIAVYKENKENTFALILLTESAEYLQLSRNGLDEEYVQTFIADSSNTAGLTASDFRTLTTTDNEGCLHNKQYICSQLWQITADNAKCSADGRYTDFSGTYNIQFDALCRSESDLGTELYGYCDDWRSAHLDEITDSTTGKVLLSAKLTWKDEICNPKVFEVQFAAEMQFFTDSGYSSRVYATDTDNYLYGVGESAVYIRIISDYPSDTLTVFDTRLMNVWLCTFDPLTPPSLDIDPGKGEGGCFADNKDDVLFGHIYDKENDIQKEGFELDTTTDLESNVIQFKFVVPSKVVRDTLYVHAQVEVSLIESGVIRRRLLNTKKVNQMNHFVYGVGVSSLPNHNNDNNDNPKPPIHNYHHQQPLTPPQQTFVISLESPWIIAIGALLALLLTANIVFMCYYKYCINDGGSRSRGRYSAVKPEDSEFAQDSERDAINVASDPSV